MDSVNGSNLEAGHQLCGGTRGQRRGWRGRGPAQQLWPRSRKRNLELTGLSPPRDNEDEQEKSKANEKRKSWRNVCGYWILHAEGRFESLPSSWGHGRRYRGGAAMAGEGSERVGCLPSRHRRGKASGDAGQQGTDCFLVFTDTRS